MFLISSSKKRLANKLCVVLPKLVSPLQSSFVPHRDIHGNILIVHEIFSTFDRKNKKQVIWLLNLIWETYDRLNWEFIRNCFQDLGYSNRLDLAIYHDYNL